MQTYHYQLPLEGGIVARIGRSPRWNDADWQLKNINILDVIHFKIWDDVLKA